MKYYVEIVKHLNNSFEGTEGDVTLIVTGLTINQFSKIAKVTNIDIDNFETTSFFKQSPKKADIEIDLSYNGISEDILDYLYYPTNENTANGYKDFSYYVYYSGEEETEGNIITYEEWVEEGEQTVNRDTVFNDISQLAVKIHVYNNGDYFHIYSGFIQKSESSVNGKKLKITTVDSLWIIGQMLDFFNAKNFEEVKFVNSPEKTKVVSFTGIFAFIEQTLAENLKINTTIDYSVVENNITQTILDIERTNNYKFPIGNQIFNKDIVLGEVTEESLPLTDYNFGVMCVPFGCSDNGANYSRAIIVHNGENTCNNDIPAPYNPFYYAIYATLIANVNLLSQTDLEYSFKFVFYKKTTENDNNEWDVAREIEENVLKSNYINSINLIIAGQLIDYIYAEYYHYYESLSETSPYTEAYSFYAVDSLQLIADQNISYMKKCSTIYQEQFNVDSFWSIKDGLFNDYKFRVEVFPAESYLCVSEDEKLSIIKTFLFLGNYMLVDTNNLHIKVIDRMPFYGEADSELPILTAIKRTFSKISITEVDEISEEIQDSIVSLNEDSAIANNRIIKSFLDNLLANKYRTKVECTIAVLDDYRQIANNQLDSVEIEIGTIRKIKLKTIFNVEKLFNVYILGKSVENNLWKVSGIILDNTSE